MGLLILLLEILLLGIASLVGFLYYKTIAHHNYFKKRGIPYAGAGYGAILKLLRGQMTLFDLEMEEYSEAQKISSPIIGTSDTFINLGVYIADLDLARNIYVKDFEHFVNRRKFESQSIFKKMFIFMENEQWKGMRGKLSPTFTTGKIRRMFDIFSKSSERMCQYIKESVGEGDTDIDMNSVYSKYAMDVIASCCFGVDSKSFEMAPGKMSKFEEMAKRLQFRLDPWSFFKMCLMFALPKVAKKLGVEASDPVPGRYFTGVIKHVLKHRRETGERQNDFLQLMMDTQEGLLKGEEESKEVLEVMTGTSDGHHPGMGGGSDSDKLTLDDDDIVSNSVLFLIAGFDTLQSVLIFSAYALALEQDVQEKLHEEVVKTMEGNGGKLTYDSIHDMKYLDMVVTETLRFYPPALRTERVCTKDYLIPGTNSVIEKGTVVGLPVVGVHRDPKHFENPEKFDPERHLPERKSQRHPYAFTPFGHGPRNCIGMRFALTEAKTVICSLVRSFKLEPCGKTEIPLQFDNSTTLKPKNGLWLKASPRRSESEK